MKNKRMLMTISVNRSLRRETNAFEMYKFQMENKTGKDAKLREFVVMVVVVEAVVLVVVVAVIIITSP